MARLTTETVAISIFKPPEKTHRHIVIVLDIEGVNLRPAILLRRRRALVGGFATMPARYEVVHR